MCVFDKVPSFTYRSSIFFVISTIFWRQKYHLLRWCWHLSHHSNADELHVKNKYNKPIMYLGLVCNRFIRRLPRSMKYHLLFFNHHLLIKKYHLLQKTTIFLWFHSRRWYYKLTDTLSSTSVELMRALFYKSCTLKDVSWS